MPTRLRHALFRPRSTRVHRSALWVASAVVGLAAVAPVVVARPGETPDAARQATWVTAERDTLWALAGRLPRTAGVTRQQWMVALQEANPAAFEGGNMHRLRRGATLHLPTAEAATRLDRGEATARVEAQREAWLARRSGAVAAPSAAASATRPGSAAGTTAAASAPAAVPDRPIAASATAPAPSPAPSAAVTPAADASATAAPPAPSETPASAGGVPARTGEAAPSSPADGGLSPLLTGLLGLGIAGAAWAFLRRRAAPDDAPVTESSTFLDEDGIPRRRRPKITEVSEAAAEMARTVEALRPSIALVHRDGEPAPAPGAAVPGESRTALHLALAQALCAHGRAAAAAPHQALVARFGTAAQRAALPAGA